MNSVLATVVSAIDCTNVTVDNPNSAPAAQPRSPMPPTAAAASLPKRNATVTAANANNATAR